MVNPKILLRELEIARLQLNIMMTGLQLTIQAFKNGVIELHRKLR